MAGEKWIFNKNTNEEEREKVKKEFSDDKIDNYVPKSKYQDVNEEIIKNKKYSNDDTLPEDIHKQKVTPDGIASEERREGLDEKYSETLDALKKEIGKVNKKYNELWDNIMANADLKTIIERYLNSHKIIGDSENRKNMYSRYLASIHKDIIEKTKNEMKETKVPGSEKNLLETFNEISELMERSERLEKILKDRNDEEGNDLNNEIKGN